MMQKEKLFINLLTVFVIMLGLYIAFNVVHEQIILTEYHNITMMIA